MEEPAHDHVSRALRAHVPELAGVVPRRLGRGLDNEAFVAGDLVLRAADGPDVLREADLLRLLATRLPLPVPVPRLADGDNGVLAYPLLPGRPLLGRTPAPGAARRLGEFLMPCTPSTRPR